MSFASNMRASAKRLIDKYGTDMKLIEVFTGMYDPIMGESPVNEITHAVKGHISRFDNSLVVSGVVNMDDLKVMLYSTDMITLPNKEWKLEISGERLNIISVQNIITAQNEPIIYTLQVRV